MDRPILFNDSMVRAILDGRKTQTRRIVSPPPEITVRDFSDGTAEVIWRDAHGLVNCGGGSSDGGMDILRHLAMKRSPYQAGDSLWVCEAHAIAEVMEDDDDGEWRWEEVYYRATPRVGLRRWLRHPGQMVRGQEQPHRIVYLDESTPLERGPAAHVAHWRPSIHMPRWASRLTLDVTGIRIERLQDITWEDALAEGVVGTDSWLAVTPEEIQAEYDARPDIEDPDERIDEGWKHYCRPAYAHLWDSINGKRASWADNPWVWVVGFEVSDG